MKTRGRSLQLFSSIGNNRRLEKFSDFWNFGAAFSIRPSCGKNIPERFHLPIFSIKGPKDSFSVVVQLSPGFGKKKDFPKKTSHFLVNFKIQLFFMNHFVKNRNLFLLFKGLKLLKTTFKIPTFLLIKQIKKMLTFLPTPSRTPSTWIKMIRSKKFWN